MSNTEKLNYQDIIKHHPWIIERKHHAILSPDADGYLCGLLMSEYLDWDVAGFYDEKVLILKNDLSIDECIFLDMDVYRKNIRSVGHHMVMYNRNDLPENWDNYNNCIQACNIRNFDKVHHWSQKYPFGTIHLLIGILASQGIIKSFPVSSRTDKYPNPELPLLFADGVWINLFDYMENCLDWIDYLGFSDPKSILYPIFCDNDKIYSFMNTMCDFLRMRDAFNARQSLEDGHLIERKFKRSGHNLRISDKKGNPINLIETGSHCYKIEPIEKNRVIGFVEGLSKYMGWYQNASTWTWENFRLFKFNRGDFSSKDKILNGRNYNDLLNNDNPFSLAITSGANIEFTLENT